MLEKISPLPFTLAVFFFLACGVAEGGVSTEELLAEINTLKARVAELEKKLAGQERETTGVTKIPHGAEREKAAYAPSGQGIEIKKVPHGAQRHIAYEPGKGVYYPPAGLNIGADATFVLQGTPNANNAGDGEDSRFDGSWSMDLEIEKTFKDFGMAFMHLEAGQNDTIESELSVFSNVNRDAMSSGSRVEITSPSE